MQAFSNHDIEEIISKEKSCQDRTISDFWNEDFNKQKSDEGTVSPYISDYNDIEHPMSLNSVESHERNSEVSFWIQKLTQNIQKYDENLLNPVSIFNEDSDENLHKNSDLKEGNIFTEISESQCISIATSILNSFIQDIRENLFPQRSHGKLNDGNSIAESFAENPDLIFNDNYEEMPQVIRVSEISWKTTNRREIDRKMITAYCNELKEVF